VGAIPVIVKLAELNNMPLAANTPLVAVMILTPSMVPSVNTMLDCAEVMYPVVKLGFELNESVGTVLDHATPPHGAGSTPESRTPQLTPTEIELATEPPATAV